MSWPLVQLGTVAQVNPRIPKDIDEDQEVSFLKMASVSEGGEILEQERRILSDVRKGFTYFQKNDLLLAKITPCFENGKAARTDTLETNVGFGSTEFHVIRPLPDIDGNYLFYLIWNENFRFLGKNAMKGAVGQQRVPVHFIEKLKIPLPPLETQKQIAAILEKADQLRKDCQQMEQELNSLAQSVFMDMFGNPVTNPKGWKKKQLSELVDVSDDIKCGPFGTQLGKDEFVTSGVPLWGIKHVNTGFKKPTSEFVTEAKFEALKSYSIEAGDIVMTRKGTVGNCYIYPEALEIGVMHSDLLRIRPSLAKVNPHFLQKQFMYSQDIEGQLQVISQGAIMAGINVTKLKFLNVLSPPLKVQEKFAEILKSIGSQLDAVRAKEEQSEFLFEALMQQAFKGELRLLTPNHPAMAYT